MSEFIRERWQRAKRDYYCDCCERQSIRKGQRYQYICGTPDAYNNQFSVMRLCHSCWAKQNLTREDYL